MELNFVNEISKELGPLNCTVSVVQSDQIYFLIIDTDYGFQDLDWEMWGIDVMFDIAVKRRTKYKNRKRDSSRITYELGTLFDFLKEAQ